MADATYRMEQGPRGGFVAYVQVTSPLLKEKSGQWFVVTPENASPSPGKRYEYPTLWMAEEAARETALRLAGKISLMENAIDSSHAAPVLKKRSSGR